MRRYQLLGTEGGKEYVIALLWRDPWDFYLTIRTPFIRDRSWRVRIGLRFGPRFVTQKRKRCSSCRDVVPNDVERCRCKSRAAEVVAA